MDLSGRCRDLSPNLHEVIQGSGPTHKAGAYTEDLADAILAAVVEIANEQLLGIAAVHWQEQAESLESIRMIELVKAPKAKRWSASLTDLHRLCVLKYNDDTIAVVQEYLGGAQLRERFRRPV